jgi:hypothetical protein
VPGRIRNTSTVREGLINRTWVRGITGALSVSAIAEYLELWNRMLYVQLNDQAHRTVWRLTADGKHKAKSAYAMLHAGPTKFQGHRLIWKTWAPLRVKIFLWLAFHRRYWTGDRRRRHGLDARDSCHLCDQEQESIDHILATCPFTKELWHCIVQALGRQTPQPQPTVRRWWRRLRALWNSERRDGLDSLFALVS